MRGRIDLQPGPDGRWLVYVDGQERCRLFADSLAELGLTSGQTADAATLAGAEALARRDAARADALRLLAVRARTARELATRLARRGHDREAVAAALRLLARQGLVDDAAFAAQRTRARLAFRPSGTALLKADLEARGVDRTLARTAAGDAVAEAGGELALALRALDQYLRRRGRSPAPAGDDLRRAAAWLQRRGFSWETARAALRQRWQGDADVLPPEE